MENVVYFLGAGFSAPLGLPVMSNFLEKAKDIYFVDMVKDEIYGKAFELLNNLHKIKSDLKTDLSNIEEVLSIITMRDQIKKQNENKLFTDFIIKVIKHYQDKVNFNFLEDHNRVLHHKNSNLLVSQIEPMINEKTNKLFGYFLLSLFNVKIIRSRDHTSGTYYYYLEKNREHFTQSSSIITLNYDTVIENFLATISKKTQGNNIKISFNTNEGNNNYSTVPLLKLHGCMNKENIIPPTWSKIFNSDDNVSKDWEAALNVLSEAQHIRFIGYSLPETDSYIKYLLKAAMLNSYHLKTIDVICKDYGDKIQLRYQNFVPESKLRFYNGSFEDVLNYGSGEWYKIKHDGSLTPNSFEKTYQNFWDDPYAINN